MVFVILDNPANKDSVLDIRVPIFRQGKLPEIKSYMEQFPFPFYIILRDINALPLTLSDALRQWFLNWCLVWIDSESFQCKMREGLRRAKKACYLYQTHDRIPDCHKTNIKEITYSISYSCCPIRKSHVGKSHGTSRENR